MMSEQLIGNIMNNVIARVRAELEYAPGCHDFDHTLRVLRNAEKIAEELPEANLQIVRLSALLHDIARPEEMASKGAVCHAVLGIDKAEQILTEFDCPKLFIPRVCACIGSHRFRGDGPEPESVEAKIIFDADKLDSIGAVGVGRAFHFAGRENARLHNTEQEAINSAPYSREDSAYREYLVKLRLLESRMLTLPGKKLAAERAEFMHLFFRQLNREIYD
ncbi:HD domain-containing protein [Lentisphaerota bacterium ZTH]|nr:HD domain-containing protein [Lentisphaerota bacterium]WET06698.1 HD domain-containing protein [Lentisphaerota bacterium ZTH]